MANFDGDYTWKFCYECGYDAALDGEPDDGGDFKNFDECDAFHDGYAQALKDMES